MAFKDLPRHRAEGGCGVTDHLPTRLEQISERGGRSGRVEDALGSVDRARHDEGGEVVDVDERAGRGEVGWHEQVRASGMSAAPHVVPAAARDVTGAADEPGADDRGSDGTDEM